MKLNNKLNNTSHRPISRDIYNFIGIVKTYYDLPSSVTDRIVFIFSQINYNYKEIIGNKIPYENAVLAATLFAVREFEHKFISKTPPFDVTDFVNCIYGEAKVEENINQIYYCLLKLQYIFNQSDTDIDAGALLPTIK